MERSKTQFENISNKWRIWTVPFAKMRCVCYASMPSAAAQTNIFDLWPTFEWRRRRWSVQLLFHEFMTDEIEQNLEMVFLWQIFGNEVNLSGICGGRKKQTRSKNKNRRKFKLKMINCKFIFIVFGNDDRAMGEITIEEWLRKHSAEFPKWSSFACFGTLCQVYIFVQFVRLLLFICICFCAKNCFARLIIVCVLVLQLLFVCISTCIFLCVF